MGIRQGYDQTRLQGREGKMTSTQIIGAVITTVGFAALSYEVPVKQFAFGAAFVLVGLGVHWK